MIDCGRRFVAVAAILSLLSLTNSYAQHYGQKFEIAPNSYLNDFSIDRIAQHVYADYYMGWILRIDLKTMAVESTKYAGVAPAFGNKLHVMYRADTLYDIDKGRTYKIVAPDSVGNWPLALEASFSPNNFSPNDSNLIVSAYFSTEYPNHLNFRNYCFSLRDSTLLPIDTAVHFCTNSPQWSSDTTFVFTASDSCLAEYFRGSKRIDTLITLHNHSRITSFAYNTKEDFLAYSTSVYVSPNWIPRIYFHYRHLPSDSLMFSLTMDDPTRRSLANGLVSLCWSPDNDRLGFLAASSINEVTSVHFYLSDSSRTYMATQCDDPDVKYHLQWANEDTLIYFDANDGHLYGMNVSHVIDAIHEKKSEPIPVDFGTTSYPNPFNPTTAIGYQRSAM